MAEARACDICGGIMPHKRNKPVVGNITPMIYTGDTCTSPIDGRPDYAKTWVDTCKPVDICDKCNVSFRAWLKSRDKEKNNEK